jgi:hypothetical protein
MDLAVEGAFANLARIEVAVAMSVPPADAAMRGAYRHRASTDSGRPHDAHRGDVGARSRIDITLSADASDAPTSHGVKPQIKPYVQQTEGLVDTGSWVDIVNLVIEQIFETQGWKDNDR